MSLEVELSLYKKFPYLFARKDLDRTESCMSYGIAVAPGWLTLIDKMSEEISEIDSTIQYEQIKEKFGLLRVYTINGSEDKRDVVNGIISKYVELSRITCEVCGKQGELRRDDWNRVLCDIHHKESLTNQ